MNATLPVRSNRSTAVGPRLRRGRASDCANAGLAVLERNTGPLCRLHQRAQGARGDLGRVIVGATLDHHADLDRQETAIAGAPQRAHIARIRKITLAGDQELVIGTAAALVL